MERVKVYTRAAGRPEREASAERPPERSGRGLFADALLTRFPNLPVEEEGRLCDPRLRENFIERVFAYQRLRTLFEARWTLGDLVRFHTAHKLTLMAHSPAAYRPRSARGRGQIEGSGGAGETSTSRISCARSRRSRRRSVTRTSSSTCWGTSRRPWTGCPGRTRSLIEEHRKGLVPLIVPMTLIKHHVRRDAWRISRRRRTSIRTRASSAFGITSDDRRKQQIDVIRILGSRRTADVDCAAVEEPLESGCTAAVRRHHANAWRRPRARRRLPARRARASGRPTISARSSTARISPRSADAAPTSST